MPEDPEKPPPPVVSGPKEEEEESPNPLPRLKRSYPQLPKAAAEDAAQQTSTETATTAASPSHLSAGVGWIVWAVSAGSAAAAQEDDDEKQHGDAYEDQATEVTAPVYAASSAVYGAALPESRSLVGGNTGLTGIGIHPVQHKVGRIGEPGVVLLGLELRDQLGRASLSATVNSRVSVRLPTSTCRWRGSMQMST